MNSQAHNQLIFSKFANNIQWKKLTKSLQQIVLGNWMFTCRTIKLNTYLTSYTHTHTQKKQPILQMIKVKQNPWIHKFTKRKHGEYFLFFTLVFSNYILDMIPKEQATKLKIIKSDSIKLLIKSFHRAKETINRVKRQFNKWKKTFQTLYMIMQNI